MPTDVLIYGGIDECSSATFINDINEVLEEDSNAEICVRINTPGGSPEYTWGMIAKFNELTNKKTVKVDGKAYSMGLYFACYVDKVSALDTTQFLLHRAAYPDWIEADEDYFDAAMRTNLANINKSLRAAFEAKVDIEKFENLKSVKDKGITVDSVFSMESRIDVPLTAKEAKQIGLISEIVTITPSIKAEINSYMNSAVAKHIKSTKIIKAENSQLKTNQKQINKMDIQKLKDEHPEVFAQVIALGVEKEKDRVEACLAFLDVDAVSVKEAIASGKNLTQKQMADFFVKATSKTALTEITANAAKTVTTTEVPVKEVTADVKELEAFRAEYKSLLKVK